MTTVFLCAPKAFLKAKGLQDRYEVVEIFWQASDNWEVGRIAGLIDEYLLTEPHAIVRYVFVRMGDSMTR